MEKILVTGGAGYLGSVLVGKLLAKGHQVVVLDNLMYKQDSLIPYCHNPNFKFVYGDVRDWQSLVNLADDCTTVIPLAAIVGFPACERDKRLATDVNYYQIRHLSLAKGNYKLIYPNTNSGYGQVTDGECTEESDLTPISHYGVTKCDAERILLTNTDGIVLRLATVFGTSPRMRLDLLVNDFTYKAYADGYIVLFEKDFKRNYIHIQDVADAFIFMMENYDRCKRNVFNIGLSDANLTKLELCETIKKYVPAFSIQTDDIRQDPDKRNYIVSNAKVERFGWKAKVTMDEGIKELLQAYQILKPALLRCANA